MPKTIARILRPHHAHAPTHPRAINPARHNWPALVAAHEAGFELPPIPGGDPEAAPAAPDRPGETESAPDPGEPALKAPLTLADLTIFLALCTGFVFLLFGLDNVPYWATRAAGAALVASTLWTGWRIVRRNLV